MTEYATKNITINQGSTWDSNFFIMIDPEGSLVDFTGKNFKMQVRSTTSNKSAILELTDTNGKIVVDTGTLIGAWAVGTAYSVDDIVTYSITQLGTSFSVYFICAIANTGETPSLTSTYWSVFKQVNFKLSATVTKSLPIGAYVYDLEVIDNTVSPYVEQKLLSGSFTINAEATR